MAERDATFKVLALYPPRDPTVRSSLLHLAKGGSPPIFKLPLADILTVGALRKLIKDTNVSEKLLFEIEGISPSSDKELLQKALYLKYGLTGLRLKEPSGFLSWFLIVAIFIYPNRNSTPIPSFRGGHKKVPGEKV